MDRAVFVTGGGGRLGRLVVDALRARGTRTVSLSRRQLGEHPDDVVTDLADTAATLQALDGRPIGAILHLAAAVHSDDVVEQAARMDASIVALIRRHRVSRVVFSSTGAVYGDQLTAPATEQAAEVGDSPYARSKLRGEKSLKTLASELSDLSVTCLRIFNIAGPSFDTSLVQRLLAASEEAPAMLYPPDDFIRDYVHQSDVVKALAAALDSGTPGYRVLNVGAGVPVSAADLLVSLDISENCWIEMPGHRSVNWCDDGALRQTLGIRCHAVPTRRWNDRELGESGSA